MFCPNCGAEFRPGFIECNDCLVPLVEQLPELLEAGRDSDSKLVSVLSVANESERLLAESVLRDGGIEFVLKNYSVQHLFGAGQIGGSNLVTGPVELLVAEADHETAHALLERSSLEHRGADTSVCPACGSPTQQVATCPDCGLALDAEALLSKSAEESKPPTVVAESEEERYSRYSRYSMVWGVLWLAGVGSLLALHFGIKALSMRSGFDASSMPSAVKPWIGIVLGLAGLLYWVVGWTAIL